MKIFISPTSDAGGGMRSSQYMRPNKNCNLSSWPAGCEPGWSCNVRKEDKVDMKNDKEIPERVLDCQPCCPGFFCPHGLTCMIREFYIHTPSLNFVNQLIFTSHDTILAYLTACPLGAYCPRAQLNQATGVCEPYV